MKPSKPQLHTLLLIVAIVLFVVAGLIEFDVLLHAPRHDAIGWGFMALAAYVAAQL